MKDGLDAQLFPCNSMSVRQAWAHNPQTRRLQLRWRGVDPPLTQALVELPAGGGSPPRTSVGGQLSTWSVEQNGGHNTSDRWQLVESNGGVQLVNNHSGRCALSLGCNWTTQTRNCHDSQCHDAAACPVTAGDCSSDSAQWAWNSTTGQLRSLAGDTGKPGMALCLDAGTTYPNTACSFGINSNAPFCDPSLPTAARARDLVSKMTLDEKVDQLLSEAPAIPRLGIGRYQYWGPLRSMRCTHLRRCSRPAVCSGGCCVCAFALCCCVCTGEALHGQIGPGTTVFPQVRKPAHSAHRWRLRLLIALPCA